MRNVATTLFVLLAVSARADDVNIQISVAFFECVMPKTDPTCVAFDEASKPKSCPGCSAWRKVTVDDDTTAKTKPEYSQPNRFGDDMAKQIYGEGLPKNSDAQPVSIAHFYANHEKYGWVEVPQSQSREGTLAVLPNTVGLVVEEKGAGDVQVVYSSTKLGGDVTQADLNKLNKVGAEPIFVLPASFLAKAGEAAPPRP